MAGMKLYVWNRPYNVSFGGSIAYAIATTEDEARHLVARAEVAEYGYYPDRPPSEQFKLGPPDRVHELPYAEIYEWSE